MHALRQLFRFMRPFWLPALLAPLLMTLEVSMDLLQPRFMQHMVDYGVKQHDAAFVLHSGLLMLGVAVVGFIGGAGCTYFSTIAWLRFGTAIRDALFTKIQGLSFGNLDRLQTGGLVTRLTNDVDQVQEAALMFLRILVRAPLLAVGSLIMAALTAPRLLPLLFIIGPLVILLLAVINAWAHPLFTAMQERLDRVNTLVQENLAGVRVVKAFVRGAYESDRFETANTDLRTATVHASVMTAGVMPGMVLLINVGIVGALWFGGGAVIRNGLQTGQLLAFINYLFQMLFALMMVGMMIMRVTRADASAERILEVLHDEAEVQDPEEPVPAPRLTAPPPSPTLPPEGKGVAGEAYADQAPFSSGGRVGDGGGALAFDNVAFSYTGSEEEPVLADISFAAPPGATVVILGATGAGKSTLVHLIPRLYDVTAGAIRLDGTDLRDMTQDALWREIAIVLQETILFSGTIRENLRYGRPEATDDEIEEAARLAQAHDFISGFPDGYDTALGQRGVNLSGGQKQRLAIARALVARPRVLILDDCTSAVDMVTEAAILAALQSWEHRCTRIMVAQRIGAALDADLVLVLEAGRLAAAGTHAELWRSSPVYGEIVRSQRDGGEVRDGR